jgi:hypothetical protein
MIRFYKDLFFAILVSVSLCSCGDTEEPGGIFRESQMQRLLIGDSSRAWIMTERVQVGGNCESDKILAFSLFGTNRVFSLDLDTAACNLDVNYTPQIGSWAFKRAGQKLFVDSLVFRIPGDSLFVRVRHLTTQFLDISYHLRTSIDDSVLVEESYVRF